MSSSRNEIKSLVNEINSPIAARATIGEKTKKLLKAKGVKSPCIKGMIKIKNGLYVKPKKLLRTEEEVEKYREEFLIKIGHHGPAR